MTLCLMAFDTPAEKNLFTKLYERYQYYMLYLANGILQNHSLAEDAVQDAFLTLTRYMDRVEDVESPRTRNFLATITKSRAVDLLRKEKRYMEAVDIDDESYRIESKEEQPLEQLIRESEHAQLRECIKKLTPEHQTVLELKYVHGLKEREIAEILGVPTKTAGMRILRAREKLRGMLNGKEE